MDAQDKATTVTPPDLSALDDEDLIARVADCRDKQAFEELFGRYAGRIKGVLVKAGAAPDEADEAAQEAMLAVWRRADSYDPAKARASAWIFTIARNRRIDLIRKRQRPEPDPNDPVFRPDPPPLADAEMVAAERDSQLRDAVGSLTEPQREVVRLAFFIGLSHPEVAARINVPLGTVKSRLRLAVERLRKVLGPEFGEGLFDD
ncbi:MAG: sigma-70 family RNA polymerase sigma factor [Pseudomonadota bacterium]